MIYVIAHLKTHPGKGFEVVSDAGPLIAGTRREAGCIFYDLYQKPGEPDTLVFIEQWETREALEAHFAEPHIVAFQKATAELVADGRIEVVHSDKVEVL
ncbi:antibiotic biosynthesis monooxygenase [Rhizobium herbae]|uniref:Antibiotic biosynthesis monooxygenase n=1 Tax=Rhizobium herbae TaxID=508661 RepID=A0ABS7H6L3_9HYPH|nr:putative quinol monooxygenase [Rhizobium herbae]MBW9062891.1 antibiotic biosynthesis monooxygenase [Rhizobium herbae]